MNSKTGHMYAQCAFCHERREKNELLQNCHDVYFCKECFRRKYCAGMYGAGDVKSGRIEKNEQNFKRSTMIPDPEIYVKSKEPSNLLLNRCSVTSMMSLSKQPLRCPKPDCNKFISTFTLESHFKTEHKDVHIVSTQLDARCVSEFYPNDIRYGITQCNILLKVINQEFLSLPRQTHSTRHKMNILHAAEANPVMALLATRVAGFHLNDDPGSPEEELNQTNSEYYIANEIMRDSDKILIWLASNVATNLSYTVAASTLDNEIRQKYFGPVVTLDECPERLCRHGNGLILTNLHCARMSENGAKTLALDIVIHGPD